MVVPPRPKSPLLVRAVDRRCGGGLAEGTNRVYESLTIRTSGFYVGCDCGEELSISTMYCIHCHER